MKLLIIWESTMILNLEETGAHVKVPKIKKASWLIIHIRTNGPNVVPSILVDNLIYTGTNGVWIVSYVFHYFW